MPVPAPIDTITIDVLGRIALRLRRRAKSRLSKAKARQARSVPTKPLQSSLRIFSARCCEHSECRRSLGGAANKTLCSGAKVALSALHQERQRGQPRASPMQSEKERVALSVDRRFGGADRRQGRGRLAVRLARAAVGSRAFADRLVATVMTYFAVRISGKPADEEHHYGHGKVESVTALAETALLFVLSGVVIWEAASAAVRRPRPRRRSDALGVRRDRRFDRGRFLPRAAALPRSARHRERGAGSRRTAFRLRHVVVDRGADRAVRGRRRATHGRTQPLRSLSPSSCASPAGGSAGAPSTR